MKSKLSIFSFIVFLLFAGFAIASEEQDHEHAQNDDKLWNEEIPQFESVHDHTSYKGGQVGMSGDLHLEFAVKKDGEYRVYVTDYLRKSIDISSATGSLVINPGSSDEEQLVFTVDEDHQKYLVAKGRSREQGETIEASTKFEIPGREQIIMEFYVKINDSSMEEEMGHKGSHADKKADIHKGSHGDEKHDDEDHEKKGSHH